MAQVRVIPNLKQMIVNAHKDDVKLQEIVQCGILPLRLDSWFKFK